MPFFVSLARFFIDIMTRMIWTHAALLVAFVTTLLSPMARGAINQQCNSELATLSFCMAQLPDQATVSACQTCVFLSYSFTMSDTMTCDTMQSKFCTNFYAKGCNASCPIDSCYSQLENFTTCTGNRNCTIACPNTTDFGTTSAATRTGPNLDLGLVGASTAIVLSLVVSSLGGLMLSMMT